MVYKKAMDSNGELLFPERLSKEFLEQKRRSMGSYLFANQYQNEVIPEDEKRFRDEWLRFYTEIPKNVYNFAFIDPAIGQKDHHDFTGIAIISVDHEKNWYLRVANRYKITPTEIVNKVFEITKLFNLKAIGIESVAYQESLIYFIDQEMKRRGTLVPIKGVTRSKQSKASRILGLVPRFEYGSIQVAKSMVDFEDEYSTFPRGAHDDILDAIASLDELVYYPEKEKNELKRPAHAGDPNYERWYIQELERKARHE